MQYIDWKAVISTL